MDIRRDVVAILVGGSCAPGSNGIISAATIEALKQDCNVIGFYDGFADLKRGTGEVLELNISNTTRIYDEAGSVIRASTEQLETALEVDNALRVLEYHRVRYLVAIGGVKTAVSANKLMNAAAAADIELSIVHVPKTIFNDLPLPGDAKTFGFSTACDAGREIVQNMIVDSRSMSRWYLALVMGSKAGHLALGIGKSAAATLTLIPEEFSKLNVKLTFNALVDQIQGTICKRRSIGKDYGVVLIAEGVFDLLEDSKELKSIVGGDNYSDHEGICRYMANELHQRFVDRKVPLKQKILARTLGSELRSCKPNSNDIVLTRNLGYGAITYLLQGGNGDIICEKDGQIYPVDLAHTIEASSKNTKIRMVELDKVQFQVASQYMIYLDKSDFASLSERKVLAEAAGMSEAEFTDKFAYIAEYNEQKTKTVNIMIRSPNMVGKKLTPGMRFSESASSSNNFLYAAP